MPSLYIDGRWVASADGACSPVVNPSDATIITEVDVATDAQVQAAITAGRRAFDTTDWPRRPAAERAALLDRVAGLIDRDLEELAHIETGIPDAVGRTASDSAMGRTTRPRPEH